MVGVGVTDTVTVLVIVIISVDVVPVHTQCNNKKNNKKTKKKADALLSSSLLKWFTCRNERCGLNCSMVTPVKIVCYEKY